LKNSLSVRLPVAWRDMASEAERYKARLLDETAEDVAELSI
jgi:hypothetical protein